MSSKSIKLIKYFVFITLTIGSVNVVFKNIISQYYLLLKNSFELFYCDQCYNWKPIFFDTTSNGNDDIYTDIGIDSQYIVNTNGCKIPSLPLYNDNLVKLMTCDFNLTCERKSLLKSNTTHLWIQLNEMEILNLYNVSNINALICYYQPFIRQTDYINSFIDNKVINFHFNDFVPIQDEFIKIECYDINDDTLIYRDYHFFVPMATITNSSKQQLNDKHYIFSTNGNNLKTNLLIIGIDSLSRLNFHRYMNSTANFVLNQLHGIELFGYSKVGDNTYPNLVPVLMGIDEIELERIYAPIENDIYDNCPFIWKEFKNNNYTTIFAEDIAYIGTFNTNGSGFIKQPTDYYMRPLIYEMENNVASPLQGNAYLCLAGKRTIDVLLDYTKKIISVNENQPYFGFIWSTGYTHDFIACPSLIDDTVSEFFKTITLLNNNTFIILMSDHGLRFGNYRNSYQGMMEERLPILVLIPPKWFSQKYPLATKNLLKNQRKFTTHFDLHETIQDLIDLNSITDKMIIKRTTDMKQMKELPHRISLFLSIPKQRTCEMAGISPHWCTCADTEIINIHNELVQQVTSFTVQYINNMLMEFPQCQYLQLYEIIDATISSTQWTAHANISHLLPSYNKYLTVRFETVPGNGKFEATIRISYPNENFNITGTISRINLYGKQSHCVNDRKMKLYCYCN